METRNLVPLDDGGTSPLDPKDVAAIIVVYSSRGWAKLSEIPRIPVIEYALVFLFALIIWGGIMLVGKFRKPRQRNDQLETAN